MRASIGTSGYSYPAWKGSFYPAKLPTKQMLAFYAERFPTVEINNTFYRMPNPDTLRGWGEQVGPEFRFAIKAPQRITHQKRLVDAEADTRAFLEATAVLGDKRGPLLFQLPPFLKVDLPRLEGFLNLLSEQGEARAAFEFRHPSWFCPEVYDLLSARQAALALSETDEGAPPRVVTAPFGYLRLRKTEYREEELADWVAWALAQPWPELSVFFKHEDAGRGPAFGARMQQLWLQAERG